MNFLFAMLSSWHLEDSLGRTNAWDLFLSDAARKLTMARQIY